MINLDGTYSWRFLVILTLHWEFEVENIQQHYPCFQVIPECNSPTRPSSTGRRDRLSVYSSEPSIFVPLYRGLPSKEASVQDGAYQPPKMKRRQGLVPVHVFRFGPSVHLLLAEAPSISTARTLPKGGQGRQQVRLFFFFTSIPRAPAIPVF